MSASDSSENTPRARGRRGPRVGCNYADSRRFVLVCRLDARVRTSEARDWVLEALRDFDSHAACFDTYGRTAPAWRVRFVRESPSEVRALVALAWDGRRFVDTDALVFVRDAPRAPPLMNAHELLRALTEARALPGFVRAVGASGVSEEVFDPLWDDREASETWSLHGRRWRPEERAERADRVAGRVADREAPERSRSPPPLARAA